MPTPEEVYMKNKDRVMSLFNQIFEIHAMRLVRRHFTEMKDWFRSINANYKRTIFENQQNIIDDCRDGVSVLLAFHCCTTPKERASMYPIFWKPTSREELELNIEYMLSMIEAHDIPVLWTCDDFIDCHDVDFLLYQLYLVYDKLKGKQQYGLVPTDTVFKEVHKQQKKPQVQQQHAQVQQPKEQSRPTSPREFLLAIAQQLSQNSSTNSSRASSPRHSIDNEKPKPVSIPVSQPIVNVPPPTVSAPPLSIKESQKANHIGLLSRIVADIAEKPKEKPLVYHVPPPAKSEPPAEPQQSSKQMTYQQFLKEWEAKQMKEKSKSKPSKSSTPALKQQKVNLQMGEKKNTSKSVVKEQKQQVPLVVPTPNATSLSPTRQRMLEKIRGLLSPPSSPAILHVEKETPQLLNTSLPKTATMQRSASPIQRPQSPKKQQPLSPRKHEMEPRLSPRVNTANHSPRKLEQVVQLHSDMIEKFFSEIEFEDLKQKEQLQRSNDPKTQQLIAELRELAKYIK